MTNARIATESMEFITLMNQLDIVRNYKAVFLGRHDTPTFLASTDGDLPPVGEPAQLLLPGSVLAGLPLIHNAHLVPELGYYYAGNDVQARTARLREAIATHDAHAADYRATQRAPHRASCFIRPW